MKTNKMTVIELKAKMKRIARRREVCEKLNPITLITGELINILQTAFVTDLATKYFCLGVSAIFISTAAVALFVLIYSDSQLRGCQREIMRKSYPSL